MELSDKKYLLEQAINLGMSYVDSYLLAGLTEKEIKEIDLDKEYQYHLEAQIKIKEKELLEMYDTTLKLSVSKGNLTGIQWMLSKLNPEKWGNQPVVNKNLNFNIDKKEEELTKEESDRLDDEFRNIVKEL